VVREGVVLFGVEDFEKGTCRITSVGNCQLIDFVEDEDRIFCTRPFYAINDSPGQGSDIRPAVPTDLGFMAVLGKRSISGKF
jgi:hypothetical protein